MFAYCLNNPVNCYDPSGTAAFWTTTGDVNPFSPVYFGSGGGGAGGGISGCGGSGNSGYKDIIDELSDKTDKTLDAISAVAEDCWDAYMRGYNLQQEMQLQQAIATNDFIAHQFSSPEIISSNLNGIGIALDAGSAYCGAIAVSWAVPTLGMSVETAGSAAVALGLVSLVFYAAAWIVDRTAIEGGALDE